MKKIGKITLLCMLVALVSVGVTFITSSYLNKDGRNSYSSNYGGAFNQENFHLASMTDGGYPDFTKVAEHAVHAVVQIKSTVKIQQSNNGYIDPFEFFFGFGDRGRTPSTPREQTGLGSGVIISSDGYIITNNHVIDKASNLEVTLNDNKKYDARLVGADPVTDIALLKIDAKDLPYLPFGNSDQLKVGEWVLAIGNPMGLTSTVTAGIVSAKGRGGITSRQSPDSKLNIESFIQTDAAINSGNSGGALVNTDGQLIGINTAIYSRTGDFSGYGFAVPVSIAGKVVADLKEFGTVQRAMLGVVMNSVSNLKGLSKDDIAQINKMDQSSTQLDYDKIQAIKSNSGVYVIGFAEVSPAKQAGLQVGDVITAVNNIKVNSGSELQEQISRYRPGDKIELSAERGGKASTYTITLKNAEGTTSIVKKEDGLAIVGAAFKELSSEKMEEFGISYGVEVAGVDRNGKFNKEGITKGYIIQQINNQPVSSPDQVESMVQAAANSKDKVLFISGFYPTSGSRKYYAIDLSDTK